jgi:hypothetical protein
MDAVDLFQSELLDLWDSARFARFLITVIVLVSRKQMTTAARVDCLRPLPINAIATAEPIPRPRPP